MRRYQQYGDANVRQPDYHPQPRRARFLGMAGIVVVAVAGIPDAAIGQTPDSTLARLERRLDSLERVIAELRNAGRAPREAADDLAALRAAAQAAAAETTRPDPTSQTSRTGNLGILNPEISVTGDIVGNFIAPDGDPTAVSGVPREFEFSFQSALDPYTRTKVFITREEDFEIAGFPEEEEEEGGHGFEIEEGYMYWVGLPGGFGAKVGKFRQDIGLYNRWHTHALFDVERPLAATTFLGEDGLIQTGAAVTLPTFTVGPATQTAIFEVSRGENEALFDAGTDLSYLGRFQNFWDFGGAAYLQLGATGVLGGHDELGLDTRLLALDFAFRWNPPSRGRYRDLQVKGEWYLAERDGPDGNLNGSGGYAQVNYRLTRRWIAGARADYVNGYGPEANLTQFAPNLTWWQSEWVRVRLQYNRLRPAGGASNHTLLLQFVWAMGPHKHETY